MLNYATGHSDFCCGLISLLSYGGRPYYVYKCNMALCHLGLVNNGDTMPWVITESRIKEILKNEYLTNSQLVFYNTVLDLVKGSR